MPPTKGRGDRTIDLGVLGVVHCRPGLRSLEALDDLDGKGSLSVRVRRLALAPSLTDMVDVIFETHIDAAMADGRDTFTRDQIGEAILEVGMNSVRDDCAYMLLTAFGPVDEESDPGNAQREGVTLPPPGSAPVDSSLLQ